MDIEKSLKEFVETFLYDDFTICDEYIYNKNV
jgi:hypothetical protein